MIHAQMLIKFISIGSYSPEVGAFGTLNSLLKCLAYNLQNALTTPQNDPLPRYLRLRT